MQAYFEWGVFQQKVFFLPPASFELDEIVRELT